MRIGGPGAEKPIVRLDEDTYIDVSDTVDDFGESFFGRGGPDGLRHVVTDRAAAGRVCKFAGDVVELGINGLGAQRQHVIGPR
jgi:2,4-didehydro-3-deoxy-L-rhamnonate hydrolase